MIFQTQSKTFHANPSLSFTTLYGCQDMQTYSCHFFRSLQRPVYQHFCKTKDSRIFHQWKRAEASAARGAWKIWMRRLGLRKHCYHNQGRSGSWIIWGGAKDIIFPMSCSFSTTTMCCSFSKISDRVA